MSIFKVENIIGLDNDLGNEIDIPEVKRPKMKGPEKKKNIKRMSFDLKDYNANPGTVTMSAREDVKAALGAEVEKKKEFEIGQKVIYPGQGVCEIIDIETIQVGRLTRFYVLDVVGFPGRKIKVPVGMEGTVGVRTLLDAQKVENLFKLLDSKLKAGPKKSWAKRTRDFKIRLKSGDPEEMVDIVREGYFLKGHGFKMDFGETTIYQTAKHILVEEIALALNIPENEIEARIEEILARNC